MRKRDVRPRWGSRGAMQRGSKVTGSHWASLRVGLCLPGSQGSRQCMQVQDKVGSQMQGSPNDTDLCVGD